MTYGAVAYAAGEIAGPEVLAVTPTTDFPLLGLEIAFTTAPGSSSPAWVNVGTVSGLNRLRSGQVTRGRQRELDQYQPGRASFVLSNKDRAFDPNYSAGPYYGNLLPMKRIRLLATWAGTTYPVFDGFIDSINQSYVNPRDAVTVIAATDATKVLSNATMPSSPYALEVLADNPTAWWRLDEASGSTAYDSIGDADLTSTGTPTVGASTLIARDAGKAVTFPTNADGFTRSGACPVAGGPLTLEFVIRTSTSAGAAAGHATGISGTGFDFLVGDRFEVATATSNGFVGYTGTLHDGATHHVACVWASDGSLKIYIDGADRTSGAATVTIGTFPTTPGFTFIGKSALASGMVGTIDEVAMYSTGLSAARITAHYNALSSPWNGDTPGQRIGRILDSVTVAWPSGLRNIETGQSTLTTADIAGKSALENMQEVRTAEFGEVYLSRDGLVTFEARTSKVNQPNFGTFGDAAGEIGYADINPDYSDQLIRNDVTISRTGGIAQNARDTASISAYLTHSYVLDGMIHNADTLSRDAADFLLSEYKDPLQRFTQITVNPRRQATTTWPAVLGRELTDKITVKRRPQAVGTPISQDSVIEGINHTFDAVSKNWQTWFNVSPAFAGSFLELDTGTGRLSISGATLTGTLDTVTTTFNVTLTGADLFTTTAGDFPFDVTVGAERMTATTISGGSSPQSFTVTRSSPISHTAGEAVQVADPVRLYF